MAAPPDIAERAIQTFQDATAANRATVARTGNVIRLESEEGADVLVAADLHGNRLNFEKLLRLADLDHHPSRHLVMQEVCHGGPSYPQDAGCMSHLLLEDVARLKTDFPDRFHFLLSNHELAELTDFPISKASRMLNLAFRFGLQQMYGAQSEEVRSASLAFIASCPLAVSLAGNTFVSHSCPENVDRLGFDADIFRRELGADDFRPHGPVFNLLWGRDFRKENAESFAELVEADVLVHGHEPCPEGFRVPNSRQIILDSCNRHACFLLLPLDQPLTHSETVARIRKLD